MHHENAQHHESGSYAQAGRLPMAGARFPNQGSVVSRYAPAVPGPLPSFIRLGPELWDCAGEVTGQDAGHLGGGYAPFVVSDPREPLERVAPVQPPAAVTPPRLDRRRALLDQLDTLRRVVENDPVAARDAAYRRAFALVTAPAARQALDLNLEPPAARARYGDTLPGQATLMARRLVEAGVRFVQVNWCRYVAQQGWDTHGTGDNMGGTLPQMQDYLLPTLDRVVSTLFEDLEERGLDRSTLVVVAGEFGRTYSINRTAGRDHWPGVYPALLFGAGIPRGLVIGASDPDGMYPDGHHCRPEDLTLTIYRLLGLDPARIPQAGPPAEAAGIPGIAAGAR
jgi:hypothetical protein